MYHLAANLRTEEDRERYGRVIALAERLQERIQKLQNVKVIAGDRRVKKLPPLINTLQPTETGTGQLLHVTAAALHDTASVVHNGNSNNQSRFVTSTSNRSKTAIRTPPPHPPPSCPPPPTPPSSSLNTPIRHDSGIVFPETTATKTTTTSIRQDKSLPPDPLPRPKVSPPVSPPTSPQKSRKEVRFFLPEEEQGPSVRRIVKRLNGWSGFLTRTYLIGKEIIMSRTLVTPYRLFNATEIKTRQPKLVLKLSLAQSNDDINDDYNLTFTRSSVRKTAQAVARFATASDNTVKRALSKWIQLQTGLPPLLHASHILRDGIKVYVVYDPSYFTPYTKSLSVSL